MFRRITEVDPYQWKTRPSGRHLSGSIWPSGGSLPLKNSFIRTQHGNNDGMLSWEGTCV